MTVFSDANLVTLPSSSPRVKTRMLEQMADALDDEAAGLYRRAATFEEEEFLLSKEIGERQTEINRLGLKLEVLRGDRDRVMDQIEQLSSEAAAVRECAFEGKDEVSVPTIHAAQGEYENPTTGALFFRRMTTADQSPRA